MMKRNVEDWPGAVTGGPWYSRATYLSCRSVGVEGRQGARHGETPVLSQPQSLHIASCIDERASRVLFEWLAMSATSYYRYVGMECGGPNRPRGVCNSPTLSLAICSMSLTPQDVPTALPL